MRRLLLFAIAWLIGISGAFGQPPPRPSRVGVLVVAHGGNNRWNGLVRKAVTHARLEVPVQVVFGMGMHEEEGRAFQDAVNRLQRKGVERLAVVPLLVSSHSEVFRQYEYLFRLRAEGEWNDIKPLQVQVPVVMGPALDEDPVVADILVERALALSRAPAEETVILVAHGPVSDADAARWLEVMGRVGEEVKQRGAFAAVLSALLRDDAPAAIKEEASRQLRETVRSVSRQSRVLVVPLLVASGGIEHKIPKLLSGLPYAYDGEALLPHPKLSQWIARQAEALSKGSEGTPLVLELNRLREQPNK
jgi:sirohydrochlorin ferrochelatase